MNADYVERFARFGYAARGVVYCVVGGFATLSAIGGRSRAVDSDGALHAVLSQPFGRVLLGILAAGLVCFALWRVAQGALDADGLGSDAKALLRRAALTISAIANAALAVSAIRLAWTLVGQARGDSSAQDWTAYLLSMPFGQWLAGLAGAAVVGTGVATAWKAWRASFMKDLPSAGSHHSWIEPLGRAGYAARALVFATIGGFIVLAALHARADDARGLAGALRALEQQPFGAVLLFATAVGLFAFGAFQFVIARFRRIRSEGVPGLS